jgi:hypothetical protein
MEIEPDPQDIELADASYPETSEAERYCFAQANKVIRLYEQGRLPLAMKMRRSDRM